MTANPTIAEVLERFLAEQKERLAPRTYSQYREAVALFQRSMNDYGPQYLDKSDRELFDQLYKAKGEEHREFCQIFGPERILGNASEFLDWFLVRKIAAGKDFLRTCGTVVKKLAAWLAKNGYVAAAAADSAAAQGSAASRDLPKARELARRLSDFAALQPRGPTANEIEDHFVISRVEPGKIWLEPWSHKRKIIAIAVPREISRLCRINWRISGIAGHIGETWRLVEVWNVYP